MITPIIEPSRPRWKRRVAICLVSLLWLIVLLEGASRVIFSINSLFPYVRGFDDASWRMIWIKLHQAHPDQLYGWVSGQYAIYHPQCGWIVKPNIRDMRPDTWRGANWSLNSNSKGLRGRTEYEYNRSNEKRRIVILGDSFTFGVEVSDDETYSHYLESSLPSAEILNLGVPAYGQDQMLLYLRQEGVKYHPDVVVLGFVSMDMDRNLLSFFGYAKPKFKLVDGRLELMNVPVPTPERVLKEEPYRSKALDLAVILREKVQWKLGIHDKEARALTDLILDQTVATTRSIGATPVFMYMPVENEISNSSGSMTAGETYLHDYCANRQIACLFLRSRFRDEIQKGVKFKTQGHWGPEAHRVAAAALKDLVLENVSIRKANTRP